jgi:hypothetical protein
MESRTCRAVIVGFALVFSAASVTNAGPFTDVWMWYYTDSAMTNQVGCYHSGCLGGITRGGNEATYRRREISDCDFDTTTVSCAYYNGTGWQAMTCPW